MRWIRHFFLCKKLMAQLEPINRTHSDAESAAYQVIWLKWAHLHKIKFGKPWPGGGNCNNTPKYINIKRNDK